MSSLKDKVQKKKVLSEKIDAILQDCYFDVQGINPNIPNLDEAYLARLLTKLAVGSATVWWSLIEIKDFMKIRSSAMKTRTSKYDVPRTDSF